MLSKDPLRRPKAQEVVFELSSIRMAYLAKILPIRSLWPDEDEDAITPIKTRKPATLTVFNPQKAQGPSKLKGRGVDMTQKQSVQDLIAKNPRMQEMSRKLDQTLSMIKDSGL